MKVLIVLCTLGVLAWAIPEGRLHRHHISQNVTGLIREQGYPAQNFTVQTDDGYLLDVIRIPGGQDYRQQWESQIDDGNVKSNKPVVFLMHGLLSSAEDFVIGGPSEGLAFLLADRGYDVFLGNSRGNIYARKHTQLNPERDSAFWRFCWNDIGKKDLPAMIDEILRMTGQEKLSYIGHMQGTTVFYVMASEMPEYNNKIEKMISLGPIAFLKGGNNLMLTAIAENLQSKSWQMKNLGINEFHPSTEFLTVAGGDDCTQRNINERLCQNLFFLLNGYESNKLNMTTALKYAQRLPAGASTKQVVHLAQLLKTDRFTKYSDNDVQTQIQEYNLEKITAPVGVIYATKDKISSEENVKLLIEKLPNVIRIVKTSRVNNNLDLLFAQNVQSVVYESIYEILKQ